MTALTYCGTTQSCAVRNGCGYSLDGIFLLRYVLDEMFVEVAAICSGAADEGGSESEGRIPSKQLRLEEILRRIASVPPCSTFDEAYALLCATIDQVEDELTGLPNEPDRWMEIARIFPPQFDRMASIAGSDVKRFDSLRHVTYIAVNGAIEVRLLRVVGQPTVLFSKSGLDGRSVSKVCPALADANL